jgi:hypothetical protein
MRLLHGIGLAVRHFTVRASRIYSALKRGIALAGLTFLTAVGPSQTVLRNDPIPKIPDSYAGDQACSPCHAREFETYERTAHHLTSRLPEQSSILGTFTSGKNTLKTENPELTFKMSASARGFFETATEGLPPNTRSRTEQIDVVTGSGRVGQTYLYWRATNSSNCRFPTGQN